MMEWSDKMAIGVRQIDDQHRELFEGVNALLTASREGKGKAEVLKTLTFLSSYVKTHFRDEEALMIRHGFPGIEAHRNVHQAFEQAVAEIQKEYEEKGTSAVLVIRVQRSVVNWLLEHIGSEDRKIVAHLKGRGVA